MEKIYNEDDITWSSIEKYIPYAKVEWSINKYGISTYKLINEDDKKIDVDGYIKKHISFEQNG